MEVEILSRELIKPSTSTPPSFRNYKISLVDELSATQQVPVIFYYPADVESNDTENNTSDDSRCNILKKSLSNTLTRFYPLAGRYMKESYLVDCSDQGAEFVEARVDVRLNDLLGMGKNLKVDMLNGLLPCPIGAADEVTDPLLAAQVTMFACGGCTIGVTIPHRVADVSTISTFVNAGAIDEVRKVDVSYSPVSPTWNSAIFFPGIDI